MYPLTDNTKPELLTRTAHADSPRGQPTRNKTDGEADATTEEMVVEHQIRATPS